MWGSFTPIISTLALVYTYIAISLLYHAYDLASFPDSRLKLSQSQLAFNIASTRAYLVLIEFIDRFQLGGSSIPIIVINQ